MSPLRAGQLDRRVVIQQNTTQPLGRDAYGGEETAWSTLATVWAHKEDLGGGERFEGQQDNPEITTRWTIRHRTDVTPRMRLTYANRAYDIQEVHELGRQDGTELMTSSRVLEAV